MGYVYICKDIQRMIDVTGCGGIGVSVGGIPEFIQGMQCPRFELAAAPFDSRSTLVLVSSY